jgi:hypothetical protein
LYFNEDTGTRRGEVRNAYEIFVGKPKELRYHLGDMPTWEDNIKMDLKEIDTKG